MTKQPLNDTETRSADQIRNETIEEVLAIAAEHQGDLEGQRDKRPKGEASWWWLKNKLSGSKELSERIEALKS